MIFDSAENIGQYFDEDDAMYRAVEFVANFDMARPDGTYEIDGEDVFAMVQSVTTEPAEDREFEAHRKFIDVQMVLDGVERQDVTILDEDVEVTKEYDDAKDVMFFSDPAVYSSLVMRPGMFVIYGPTDGHKPCCQLDAPKDIRKVCVKIRID